MFNLKKYLPVFGIFIVIFGLTITVYLSSRPQGAFETRKKAAEIETVKLTATPAMADPVKRPVIKFTLSLENRKNKSIFVTIYGFDVNLPSKIDILGKTKTNIIGEGQITISSSFSGKKLLLFAQTPSHLRKEAVTYSPILIKEGINPSEGVVDFGELIAGDVYMDETGYKNNIIDSLDEITLSNAIREEKNDTKNLEWADLNGDGLVNSTDLTILSSNLGKKGDYFPLAK